MNPKKQHRSRILTTSEMAVRADRRCQRRANFGVGVGIRSINAEKFIAEKYGALAGSRYSFGRANEQTVVQAMFGCLIYTTTRAAT